MIRTPKKRAHQMMAQHCTCNPPCTTRALKRAAHGTPSEFERAVFNALGEISYAEANAAVERYNEEYFTAR